MAGPERERDDSTAFFIRDAPLDVLLRRLSPKWILRMRSVCKAWRDKLSEATLLARLHRATSPRLLLCFDRAACHDRHIQPREYCVDSLDLRSGESRLVFRFTGNGDNHAGGGSMQQFLVYGSLNGHILVSFSRRGYIINPATRHWAPLSRFEDLIKDFKMDVVGFYEHAPSGNYRVLCLRGRTIDQEAATCSYYVVTTRTVAFRGIKRPVSSAVAMDHGLGFGVDMACVSPPIQLKRNGCLHWPPQERQRYLVLVTPLAAGNSPST